MIMTLCVLHALAAMEHDPKKYASLSPIQPPDLLNMVMDANERIPILLGSNLQRCNDLAAEHVHSVNNQQNELAEHHQMFRRTWWQNFNVCRAFCLRPGIRSSISRQPDEGEHEGEHERAIADPMEFPEGRIDPNELVNEAGETLTLDAYTKAPVQTCGLYMMPYMGEEFGRQCITFAAQSLGCNSFLCWKTCCGYPACCMTAHVCGGTCAAFSCLCASMTLGKVHDEFQHAKRQAWKKRTPVVGCAMQRHIPFRSALEAAQWSLEQRMKHSREHQALWYGIIPDTESDTSDEEDSNESS